MQYVIDRIGGKTQGLSSLRGSFSSKLRRVSFPGWPDFSGQVQYRRIQQGREDADPYGPVGRYIRLSYQSPTPQGDDTLDTGFKVFIV